jgi:hypothetical protein
MKRENSILQPTLMQLGLDALCPPQFVKSVIMKKKALSDLVYLLLVLSMRGNSTDLQCMLRSQVERICDRDSALCPTAVMFIIIYSQVLPDVIWEIFSSFNGNESIRYGAS